MKNDKKTLFRGPYKYLWLIIIVVAVALTQSGQHEQIQITEWFSRLF